MKKMQRVLSAACATSMVMSIGNIPVFATNSNEIVAISETISTSNSQEKRCILFENSVPENFLVTDNSKLSISEAHKKFGKNSLEWQIGQTGKLFINSNIGYGSLDSQNRKDLKKDSFAVYIYNENPVNKEALFEFTTNKNVDCSFKMNMNFKGWRSAWVMFDRDMEGTPKSSMNGLTITMPEELKGNKVYFSTIILSTPLDARHHPRTYQNPNVNIEADKGANSHWMSLYSFDKQLQKNLSTPSNVTQNDISQANEIKNRTTEYILNKKSPKNFEELKNNYEKYNISINENGTSGKSVDFDKAFAIFDEFDKNSLGLEFVKLREFSTLMYDIANFYLKSSNTIEKEQAKQMYLNMFKHLIDQGMAHGSGIGTIHHIGYDVREYFNALYLMENVLKEENLLNEAQQASAWFSGLGRIYYENLDADGINMDVLTTQTEGMLTSILMIENENQRVKLLKQFTKWLTFACSPKSGLKGPFKSDGSGYHHTNFYPAYTNSGIIGVTPVVYLLSKTDYRLPQEQHEIIKKAVMNFRLFSNQNQYLISVSGRHPKGTESFSIAPFKWMSLAGTPDGSEEIDSEVARAYMRLTKPTDAFYKELSKKGFEPESAPNGNWSFNYGSLALHRRNEWLVGAKGYSRYLWANETYEKANLYGRYISHGHVQIMSKGNPVNNQDSGYYHDGWDWNSWPGTTTIHLPIDELKSDVKQVDVLGGVEEMLLSDETYSGALNIQNENGMFAMKLHEHPKYNGSHRARKSVFMFDNRIICLGTNIENNNTKYPTNTTLFQNYLTDISEPIFVNNSQKITGLDYQKTLTTNQGDYILDNNNNGYILEKGQKITLTRKNQESRSQDKGSVTYGDFTKAVIEHGKAPKAEDYEYMILVDTTYPELEKTANMIKQNKNNIYTVLQKDYNAHIVKDIATNTTGYALFEANNAINKGLIQSVDTPSMIMTKETDNSLILSVCDPDLRYYEGIDKSQYDENGQLKEVSPYGLSWISNEGKKHTMRLELKGNWKLANPSTNCRIVENKKETTVLELDCKEALKIETTLVHT